MRNGKNSASHRGLLHVKEPSSDYNDHNDTCNPPGASFPQTDTSTNDSLNLEIDLRKKHKRTMMWTVKTKPLIKCTASRDAEKRWWCLLVCGFLARRGVGSIHAHAVKSLMRGNMASHQLFYRLLSSEGTCKPVAVLASRVGELLGTDHSAKKGATESKHQISAFTLGKPWLHWLHIPT